VRVSNSRGEGGVSNLSTTHYAITNTQLRHSLVVTENCPKKTIRELELDKVFGIIRPLATVARAARMRSDQRQLCAYAQMSQGVASKATASSPEMGPLSQVHDVPLTEQFVPKDRDNVPVADKDYPFTTGIEVALARQSTADARTLASVDRLSTESDASIPTPSKVYHPFSPAVVALLMPASIFGTLARLGLQALATYDGKAIFPLAYPQAIGCLIMGIALPLKDAISN
jgi:hypothetical protein